MSVIELDIKFFKVILNRVKYQMLEAIKAVELVRKLTIAAFRLNIREITYAGSILLSKL